MLRDVNATFVFAFDAFAVSVSDVLLVTDWTMPIEVVASLRRILSPTETWVRKDVPVPVTVAEVVALEIVPVSESAVHVSTAFHSAGRADGLAGGSRDRERVAHGGREAAVGCGERVGAGEIDLAAGERRHACDRGERVRRAAQHSARRGRQGESDGARVGCHGVAAKVADRHRWLRAERDVGDRAGRLLGKRELRRRGRPRS